MNGEVIEVKKEWDRIVIDRYEGTMPDSEEFVKQVNHVTADSFGKKVPLEETIEHLRKADLGNFVFIENGQERRMVAYMLNEFFTTEDVRRRHLHDPVPFKMVNYISSAFVVPSLRNKMSILRFLGSISMNWDEDMFMIRTQNPMIMSFFAWLTEFCSMELYSELDVQEGERKIPHDCFLAAQVVSGYESTVVLGNDDGYIYFVDVSDPENIDATSEFSNFDIGDVVLGLAVAYYDQSVNRILFVSSNSNANDELQLYDVTTETSPVLITGFDFGAKMYGVAYDTTQCAIFIVGAPNTGPQFFTVVAGDAILPEAVTDLLASSPTDTTVDLVWTAPGDDGAVGTAVTYDIRYSTSIIDDSNWASATEVTGEPTPSIAGTVEAMTVTDLDEGTIYYFAIKTLDEVPNTSGISNIVTETTTGGSQLVIRTTEYYLAPGSFSGTGYDLTLDQDLKSDYFVIVQGSDGDGSGSNNRGPDENYAALTADPFGTGDLDASSGNNIISLTRGNFVNSWSGVVTVVECLADCNSAGFELLTVEEVTHGGTNETGSDTSVVSWTDIDQIMLMGGYNGSGCVTEGTSTNDHSACQAKIYPSLTNVINWERESTGGSLTDATSTVMVVDWGTEWDVQRANVTGNNGGAGANAVGEYDTASITSVVRENTWVWGTGWTEDGGIGDSSEGTLITLGDGVNINTNETTVAVGQEYSDNRAFEVYTLTHPALVVDYGFKVDGNSGDLTYDANVTSANNSSSRMALISNGCNGTGAAFPRPIFSARYLNDTTIRLERRRSGQDFPAWIQGVDFAGLVYVPDLTAPSSVGNLAAAGATADSVDLSWTAPGNDAGVGTATSYDIRYSTSIITEGNWTAATLVSGEPTPSIAGTSESMTVSGLSSSTTYYFAIKTLDVFPNTSDISNITNETTLVDLVCEVDVTGTFIEAENFNSTISQGTGSFTELTTLGGYSGTGYLYSNGGSTTAPPIHEGKEYILSFPETGTYNVWMRGYATGAGDNSNYIGLNGTYTGALAETIYDQWVWTNIIQTGLNTVSVSSIGQNVFNLWVRESAHSIDAVYITKGSETPSGVIPSGAAILDPTVCDIIPPTAVSDFAASTPTLSSIDLAWTASGDDGSTGTATTYDIRYSTSTISEGNWAAATQVTGEPTPSIAGTAESMTVSGLSATTTYYFAIKISDEVPNTSTISNISNSTTLAAADTTAPAAVSDLVASNPSSSSIDLAWTARGDDGATGTATIYDIRYSTSLISEGNWATATQATGEPIPSLSGSAESMTVTGLSATTTYHFAIKILDEVGNTSTISNISNSTTLTNATQATYLVINTSSASIGGGGNKELQDITVENTSGSNITIDTITLTWTNGQLIEEIKIDNAKVWRQNNEGSPDGRQPTGTEIDIVDFVLSSGTTYDVDKFKFNGNMTGDTFSITFKMSDASTKVILGISL